MAATTSLSCNGQQGLEEVKRLPESSIVEDPSPISDNAPPQIAGHKRKRRRSSSPSRNHRARLSPPEEADHRESLEVVNPEINWHCPSCGLPCWRCHSSSRVAHDRSELHEDHVSEPESMEPPSVPASAASLPPSELSVHQHSIISKSSGSKRKKCEERGFTYVGPKDAGFQSLILVPCGLVLNKHVPPELTPTQKFDCQNKFPTSRVFIHKTQAQLQDIIEDLVEYKIRGYDENTLTTLCHDSIVLRDRFIPNDVLDDTSTTIKSVRRDKWKPRRAGPPIPKGDYTYDWDLEPDSTYAVSINMFTAEDRRVLRSRNGWLADDYSACPYLTIEYKCADKSGKSSDATSQVATASMLWLYQRRQISDALGRNLDALRHYAITFVDADFTVYEARFKHGFYEVRALASGNLTRVDDLKTYIEWSNAIHAWGLGPNAISFKDDIRTLLKREKDHQSLPSPSSINSLVGPSSHGNPTPTTGTRNRILSNDA